MINSIFQVVTLVWTLQGGQYLSDSKLMVAEANVCSPFFFDASFEFQFPFSLVKEGKDQFFIGADTETQFFKNPSKLNFNPWQDTFTFHTGIRLFGTELGYDHQCVHPIVNSDGSNISRYFSGYDKIFLKVSGTF